MKSLFLLLSFFLLFFFHTIILSLLLILFYRVDVFLPVAVHSVQWLWVMAASSLPDKGTTLTSSQVKEKTKLKLWKLAVFPLTYFEALLKNCTRNVWWKLNNKKEILNFAKGFYSRLKRFFCLFLLKFWRSELLAHMMDQLFPFQEVNKKKLCPLLASSWIFP